MHRRSSTNGLNRKQVNELTHGWEHARRIGCPLNAFITIRPFEDAEPAQHCDSAARIRNKLGVFARHRGFPFVAAWVREFDRDGNSGEHLHVLMHVPQRHFADLVDTVIGWFPEPTAADVRRADQKMRITDNGKCLSAIGYLAKQMTPQAAYKRGLIRKGGGPVLGKRGGVTRNIGPAAIEKYFEDLRAAYRPQPRTVDPTLVPIVPRQAEAETIAVDPLPEASASTAEKAAACF